MAVHYIGADVDSRMTNLAVERNGRIVKELCVPTTIPCLRAALDSIGHPRVLTLEEGPMAHWLGRGLRPWVDELVICDPRRNHLIDADGDKDDAIDARKLAALLRGGYLRAVYHSDDEQRVLLKRWVGLYDDRVQDAVRQINKIRGHCWQYGVRPSRRALRNIAHRQTWLEPLGKHPLRAQLAMLFVGFDAVVEQVAISRERMMQLSRPYAIIRRWRELPGVGPIRAITIFAYLDTPWRFAHNRHGLWKYCGVGLERCSSGKDRYGRMRVGKLHLAWRVNRRLKAALMGAAISAIQQGDNVFAERYERLVTHGLTASNARHAVARKMLTVMWGMWKTGSRFDPTLARMKEADGNATTTTTATAVAQDNGNNCRT